jgi:hypothetical protein
MNEAKRRAEKSLRAPLLSRQENHDKHASTIGEAFW